MATRAVTKIEAARLQALESPTWGVSRPCRDDTNCQICQRYFETPAILHLRNCFLQGMLIEDIARTFDVEVDELRIHARRQKWFGNRRMMRFSAYQITETMWQQMVMARFRQAANYMTPQTADRMLELLGKSLGVGQKVKVEVEGKMTWEQMLVQTLQAGDALPAPSNPDDVSDADVLEGGLTTGLLAPDEDDDFGEEAE